MEVFEPLQHLRVDFWAYAASYKFYVEAATIALLCYIGYTDLRTFKIRNETLVLLLVLYALYAVLMRSAEDILFDVLFGAVIFGFLLFPYARKLIGGGDVKFIAVACVWAGTHCALIFSGALFILVVLHLTALRMRWIVTIENSDRQLIPYGPSVAGALISVILLGCT
jgi:Flp pilus assembly protein protease CpaA